MSSYAPPVQRLVTELSKLPGIGSRTAQRLAFHILRASPEDAVGAGRVDPRGEGEDRLLRGLLQPHRRAALPHLPGHAPRPRPDLRRRGALRRDPDGAHARVRGRLPRARRRALADRRDRPRGPAHRRAARARVAPETAPTARRCARCPRHQPDDDRRNDRAAHRRGAARRAPPSSRSRAWPAACRSARTSSTPTRSRSARPSPAAAPCRQAGITRHDPSCTT